MSEVLTWIWVLTAGLGLGRSMLEALRASKTKDYLYSSGINGALVLVAESSFWLEVLRATAQSFLLLAGLLVLTGVSEVNTDFNTIRLCLVFTTLILFIKSEIAAHTRRMVLKYKEEDRL